MDDDNVTPLHPQQVRRDPELQEILTENNERLQRLSGQGIQIDINGLILRHLVDTLFTTIEAKEAHERSFQAVLTQVLDSAESQLNRIRLQQGVGSAGLPSLIVPGG